MEVWSFHRTSEKVMKTKKDSIRVRRGAGNCIKVFRRKVFHGEPHSGKKEGISLKIVRKPPSHPTSLRPKGISITLPKPSLIIDSMPNSGDTSLICPWCTGQQAVHWTSHPDLLWTWMGMYEVNSGSKEEWNRGYLVTPFVEVCNAFSLLSIKNWSAIESTR